MMDTSGGCNHCVLNQPLGFLVHQSSPFTKTTSVHWQNFIESCETIHPTLYFLSFSGILSSRQLNASLQLTKRNCGNKCFFASQTSNPTQHCFVRLLFTKLRNDIGIE